MTDLVNEIKPTKDIHMTTESEEPRVKLDVSLYLTIKQQQAILITIAHTCHVSIS